MAINTLDELAAIMPTERSYQLVMNYIARGGKADKKRLRTLAIVMPTEESYQLVGEFVRGVA